MTASPSLRVFSPTTLFLVFLGTVSFGLAACRDPISPPLAGVVDTAVFEDFSTPELDRTRWNVFVTGRSFNSELQAYIDDPRAVLITVPQNPADATSGVLTLQAAFEPAFATMDGRRFDFTSGRVDTRGKLLIRYGTFAARMKLPAEPGLWPALWLLGEGEWPRAGEIDVLESVGDPSWTNAAVHGPNYSGGTPFTHRHSFSPDFDGSAWHVYSVDWTPDSLVFSVDGASFYRVTRPEVERYGDWVFDTPKYVVINLAVGGDYPAAINGAPAPYVGLPPTTQQHLREHRIQLLVDWVRFTPMVK